MKINSLIDYFIPGEYLNNKELYRKSRFIVWFFFIIIPASLLFGGLSVIGTEIDPAIFIAPIFLLIILVSLLFVFKAKGSFALVTHVVCGLFTLLMIFLPAETGGLFSPDMTALYIFPLFALIMGSFQIGLLYATINILIMIGYYFLALDNSAFYFDKLDTVSSEYFFSNLLINFLVIIFLVFRNEKIRQKLLGEVTEKNIVITEKNKEIEDSIKYAKRIQQAILPPQKLVKTYLPESFILYKPKDIVAGDFYWIEHVKETILFAAADCTGHGVPGAMVSVICNNGLNRSLQEHALFEPGKILDKTREIVAQEFEKSEEDVKDGMDISLCALDRNNLRWAGANNPLWIIRNGEILETKPDKQAIGKVDKPTPFTTHQFNLEKGDSIYIFTDGFQDQFGGQKGKKFKPANFKKLLLSIQEESMEKQRKIIDTEFEKWKGDLEQVDDVCVIGVRI